MHCHLIIQRLFSLCFLSVSLLPLNAFSQESDSSSQQRFRIHGSNTIGEKFAPDLIKQFLLKKGYLITNRDQLEALLERELVAINPSNKAELNVELFAHGSSTGFKDLLSLTTDVAMSSRQIKPKERELLSKSYPSINDSRSEHIIAFDALAIIVHPENTVAELSISQLASIFSGEITNWSELGGDNRSIELNARDNNSGTYDTFKSLVLKPADALLATSAQRYESSAELSKKVSDNLGGIGFVGVSHTGSSKVLAISKTQGQLAVLPEGHTIGTEDYPLSRKLYLYLPTEINNKLAHEFVDFCKSTYGQSLAKRSNLVSFYPTKSKPVFENIRLKGVFNNLRTYGERLSISFQIEKKELDSKNKRDLERLKSYHRANPLKRIVLAGFESKLSTNQDHKSLDLWLNQLKSELSENEIEPWEVRVGPSSFIGDQSEINKLVRQRVEIWVI